MTTRSQTGSSLKKSKPEESSTPSAEISSPDDFLANVPIEFKVGKIITLPNQMYFTNDPRFGTVDQSVLYTSTMDKLFHTVHYLLPSVEDDSINLEKLEKPHRIYLYENIGIGKSFHLFSLYHRLKRERKDLRILYIQNCKNALDDLNMYF